MTKRRAEDYDVTKELEIQCAVFRHLRVRPNTSGFAFHPKNSGSDMALSAGLWTGRGVRPGIPDVIIMTAGYALELKTPRRLGAKPTMREQRQAMTRMEMSDAGIITGCVYSLDDALNWLEAHKLLRGTRT